MASSHTPVVLITNDDGPLSDESPFIETFIEVLQRELGWKVRVCIPDAQRSWIAKAFLVNEAVVLKQFGPLSTKITAEKGSWYMASGTPAGCVNIALNHLFPDIDLVISGPNLGSNVANTCAMASGTLGAAMEAAIDNKRAVALSFAFYNRDISEAKALNASHIACSILKKLWSSDAWKASGSSVFNVNIPLVDDPSPPVHITRMGTSRFGSLYKKIEDAPGSSSIPRAQGKGEIDNSGLSTSQKRMRIAVDDGSSQGAGDKENSSAGGRIDGRDGSTYAFSASVAVETAADPGTDSWAVHQKAVSITPLQPALLSLGNCQNPELWTSLGFTPLD